MCIALSSILALLAYLMGSIPVGLILSLLKGVDIRKVGSGNIGATNVFRSVSKPLGILTFILDFLKGLVPAALFPILLRKVCTEPSTFSGEMLGLLFGFLGIAGHNWSVFLRFRGGKGIATSAGVLAGVAPEAMLLGLLAWVVLFLTTRYVSVASIGAAVAIGLLAWPLYKADTPIKPTVLTILAAVALWRHRSNMRRLLTGTEYRFDWGKKKSSTLPPDANHA